jgi:hypothetical protein
LEFLTFSQSILHFSVAKEVVRNAFLLWFACLFLIELECEFQPETLLEMLVSSSKPWDFHARS